MTSRHRINVTRRKHNTQPKGFRACSSTFLTGYTGWAIVHYIDVIMTTMASQITSLIVVYSTFYSDADHRKHQSSASLAFVWGSHYLNHGWKVYWRIYASLGLNELMMTNPQTHVPFPDRIQLWFLSAFCSLYQEYSYTEYWNMFLVTSLANSSLYPIS